MKKHKQLKDFVNLFVINPKRSVVSNKPAHITYAGDKRRHRVAPIVEAEIHNQVIGMLENGILKRLDSP